MVCMQNQKWPENWKTKVMIFNDNCNGTTIVRYRSTAIITKQHEKKEWGYKCNDQPMCSFVIKNYVSLENLV